MRRRMAERRRRRAKANETEQEGEEKQADEPHYLGANLLEGLKSTGTRWNGGVAKNPELQQWRRFWELGVARARAAAAGLARARRVSRVPFIGAGAGLGVRATPSRRGRAAALGLGEESRPVPSSGMTGGSPRVREREKGGKGRSGLGRELGRRKGTGPRERFLGRGMKEKKKRWVGLKEREKEK